MITLQTDNTTNPHVVTLIERKTTMPAQEPETLEARANRFRDGTKRALGIIDDVDIGRRIACQTYHALLSIANYPREQLSDVTLACAIAAGVSDALCRFTKEENLEGLTEKFVEAIREDNQVKIDEGIRSETLLWPISLADEKSLTAGIAERLEQRIRHDEWRSRIFNGDESLSFEEFKRRAQGDPMPTGPLDAFWQMKRSCKEIISRFGATDPMTATAEVLLRTIEREQPVGTAQVENGGGSHE